MASARSSAELLAIGKQCSHSTCNLVDFLPFTCQHCQFAFCQEHFMVDAHECPNYDASKHNRVAPDCPFCHIPVAVKPGQDPNVRLEDHFEKECAVLGKKAKKSPVCANNRCKKVLFAPISCKDCNQQFCPAHRFPDNHTCTRASINTTKPSQSSSNVRSSTLTAGSRLLNLSTKASDAIKKSITTSTSAPTLSTASSSSSKPIPTSSSSNTVFSKTDSASRLVSSSSNGTTTNLPNATSDDSTAKSSPEPVIKPLSSFVPPPIFATA